MRHSIFLHYLLLSFLVSFSSSCSEDKEGAVDSLVRFGEGGCITVDFSHQNSDVEHKINVVSKGTGTSTTQITLFTQKELTAYNQKHATNYWFMPEGTYELSATSLSFPADAKSKEVSIKIHPGLLFDIVRRDTEDKTYTIPLKLSDQPVSNSSSTAIYIMNMSYPRVCLQKEASIRLLKEESEVALEAYTYEKQGSPKLIPNQGDVDLELMVPEKVEEWLKLYNDTSSTKYHSRSVHTNLVK